MALIRTINKTTASAAKTAAAVPTTSTTQTTSTVSTASAMPAALEISKHTMPIPENIQDDLFVMFETDGAVVRAVEKHRNTLLNYGIETKTGQKALKIIYDLLKDNPEPPLTPETPEAVKKLKSLYKKLYIYLKIIATEGLKKPEAQAIKQKLISTITSLDETSVTRLADQYEFFDWTCQLQLFDTHWTQLITTHNLYKTPNYHMMPQSKVPSFRLLKGIVYWEKYLRFHTNPHWKQSENGKILLNKYLHAAAKCDVLWAQYSKHIETMEKIITDPNRYTVLKVPENIDAIEKMLTKGKKMANQHGMPGFLALTILQILAGDYFFLNPPYALLEIYGPDDASNTKILQEQIETVEKILSSSEISHNTPNIHITPKLQDKIIAIGKMLTATKEMTNPRSLPSVLLNTIAENSFFFNPRQAIQIFEEQVLLGKAVALWLYHSANQSLYTAKALQTHSPCEINNSFFGLYQPYSGVLKRAAISDQNDPTEEQGERDLTIHLQKATLQQTAHYRFFSLPPSQQKHVAENVAHWLKPKTPHKT